MVTHTPVAVPRKARIVLIGHLAGDTLGGSERSLLDVLAAVDRREYDVSCVLPAGNDDYLRAIARHADDISVFPYHWWNGSRHGNSETVSRFAEIFRRVSADIVHVNTITLMDPLLAAKSTGAVSILHARELIYHAPGLARCLGATAFDIVCALRSAADFIIGNSEATLRLYHKESRSFLLYNCVDVDAFDIPNEVDPKNLKIGIISNNSTEKGIEYFVRLATMAARRGLDLEFVVIGQHTELTEDFARTAQGAEVPVRIRFTGYLVEPVEAVRQVNVVVSLSIVPESFGRTLVEAMAARRPVVAFDGGAVAELVRHGQDGFIVPYLDLEAVLEHLATLAGSPDRLAAIGRSARARAEELFSPVKFAAELNGIYQHVLSRPAAGAASTAPPSIDG